MLKSKKIKAILMIIIFGILLFTVPNFSKATEKNPEGILKEESRTYEYINDKGQKSRGTKKYLISTTPEGPKCSSKTDWEFHINLTNFNVYVYHKEDGKWKIYKKQRCAAGRIDENHGLSITNSSITYISRIEYRSSTDFSSFYYCLWTPTNYAMHSVLYDKDKQKPEGGFTFGEGKYVSGACIRMDTEFVKKLYTEQGENLKGSKVIAYYTGDCFLFKMDKREKKEAQWVKLNGNKYYFKKNGYLASGPTKIDNKVYYFNLDGTFTTKPRLELRDHKFYLVDNKGMLQTGWKEYNGKVYYFSPKSYAALKGLQVVDGEKYYFDDKYGYQKNGWQTIGDNKYYFKKAKKEAGKAAVGFHKINNKAYYFWEENGTNSGNKHLKATLATGNQKINNIQYYISKKGVIETGWKKVDGKKYYYSPSNGKIATGFKTIDNKTYYFSTDKGQMVTGLNKINNEVYYFNKKGVQQTGWQTIGNNKYYFKNAKKEEGKALTGFNKIDNKWYYFWKKDGTNLDVKHEKYQMATGLISLSGKQYYLSDEGVRQTGLKTIDNKKYYFDTNTGVAISGFKTVNNKTYYFSPDDFKAVVGLQKIDNKNYYFNEKGVRQTGWQVIKGKQYYFDTKNGVAYTDVTKKINKKSYTFDKNGVVV